MLNADSYEDKVSVLVIDDDEDDYQIICDLLRDISDRSFDVSCESCYETGLEQLGSGRFDVCFAGYCIGGRTGSDFLRAARETGVNCPIILLSGVVYGGVESASSEPGVIGLINKSELTSDKVRTSIDRAVEVARV